MKLTLRNSLIALVFAALAATIGVLYSLSIPAHKSFGDVTYESVLPTMDINQGVSVGPSTSVQILATSTARLYIRITNPNATTVYCNLSDASSSALTSSGLAIIASSSFDIGPNNLYTGAIRCGASASTTINITGQQ